MGELKAHRLPINSIGNIYLACATVLWSVETGLAIVLGEGC